MTPERRAKYLQVIKQRQPDLTVLMEDVHDPHNISAVMRTCDSVGIMEIFALYQQTKIEKLRLGKRSSGSARKWVDIQLYTDQQSCFKQIRSKYEKVYCTHLSENAVSLYDLDLTGSVALVFGNEKDGICRSTLEQCDGNFHIPQVGMVQSLNISVACAITLYEAFRQRLKAGMYDNSKHSQEELDDLFREYEDRQKRLKGSEFIIEKND